MGTARDVTAVAAKFYNKMNEVKNSRYRSWEYCYYSFYKARTVKQVDEDYLDYLSLQLAFYLASWGMFRGSFLLQKDYKIHVPLIKEMLNPKYDILFGLECKHMSDANVRNLLTELIKLVSKHYKNIREDVKRKEIKSSVSDTLVSKVLMGTMGCVPAYDTYFKAGIKNKKVAKVKFNMDSLIKLAEFYQQNYDVLEEARSQLQLEDIYYPQMKLLDMGFWQIGADWTRNRR
ncbi:MAG: hypothetical protein IJ671_08160 [Succinivibrio sp.]|nr:hypothetical protein [Succinivibrio sp.]